MSVTISNVRAAICSVDVSGLSASPVALPKFFGPGARQFANAGFGLFAGTPAPDANSERLAEGIYRMHITQPFTFTGGEAAPLATLNPSAAEIAKYGAQDFYSIYATGADYGAVTTVGCDVMVLIGATNLNDPSYDAADLDFSLWVLQYPQQNTQ